MELRYKTSLEELVEGILLISCRSPLRFIFCYIIVGTLFPLFLLYVFIYTIYYLYFYPTPSYLVEELVEQLILCVTELSLWGVAVGFRKPMMKWCTKRAVFNRIVKKNMYFMGAKTTTVKKGKIKIEYDDRSAELKVYHVIEYKGKYYLYEKNYKKFIDVIAKTAFRSEEEEKNFLKELNLPVEAPKRNLFL